MEKIFIDLETYSEANLPKVGIYRYAFDASTEIRILHVSNLKGDGFTWTFLDSRRKTKTVASFFNNYKGLIYAHNAQFEYWVLELCYWRQFGYKFPIPYERFRCTSAMARRAGFPPSLAHASKALKLSSQKDTKGHNLIKRFSMPSKYEFDKYKFREFVEYCIQDVKTEVAIYKKLKYFDTSENELSSKVFEADKILNCEGIPVNLRALDSAKLLVDTLVKKYAEEFKTITNLSPSQNVKVLAWFKAKGYPKDSLKAEIVQSVGEKWITDNKVLRAWHLRKKLRFIALKKIETMLKCEVKGKVYGAYYYHGASTGRWSGVLIQPQNFKSPTPKMRGYTDEIYKIIQQQHCPIQDTINLLETTVGDPLEAVASCMRHFIQPPKGQEFYNVDYSSIEARIVCWLANDIKALENFKEKKDSYTLMAQRIFKKDVITREERELGKFTVLGCGYGMGPEKFLAQFKTNVIKYGIKFPGISLKLAIKAVRAFREEYKDIRNLWWEYEDAARKAIQTSSDYKVNGKVCFRTKVIEGIKYLFITLPSGRKLAYPKPWIREGVKTLTILNLNKGEIQRKTKTIEAEEIMYFGKVTKYLHADVPTYGAKLVENVTQAIAADVMANGLIKAQRKGFKVVALIHDEALAYKHKSLSLNQFINELLNVPKWASGIPLEAEGNITPYYKK